MVFINTAQNYRKIWESHYGPIPKDNEGRSYEIHHVDGDRDNNDISNLVCVTLQEHYDIHFSQGDWSACLLMADRMKTSPEEKSILARRNHGRRVARGDHPFLTRPDGSSLQQDKIKNNTHPFQKRADGSSVSGDRVKQGNHPFVGSDAPSQVSWTCEYCKKSGKSKSNFTKWHKNGKCQLSIDSSHHSQYSWTCEYCNKNGKGIVNYKRWHGNNCAMIRNDLNDK
jgi:hypothetical protein